MGIYLPRFNVVHAIVMPTESTTLSPVKVDGRGLRAFAEANVSEDRPKWLKTRRKVDWPLRVSLGLPSQPNRPGDKLVCWFLVPTMLDLCRLLTAYPDAVFQRISGKRRWLLWILRVTVIALAITLAYCLFAATASIPDTPLID